jgi:hypothetical protein
VEAGTEIDEPSRQFYQRRQYIGRQRVRREDVRQAVLGLDAPRLQITDRDVVDDRIEPAEGVRLLRHGLGAGDRGHVPNDNLSTNPFCCGLPGAM